MRIVVTRHRVQTLRVYRLRIHTSGFREAAHVITNKIFYIVAIFFQTSISSNIILYRTKIVYTVNEYFSFFYNYTRVLQVLVQVPTGFGYAIHRG